MFSVGYFLSFCFMRLLMLSPSPLRMVFSCVVRFFFASPFFRVFSRYRLLVHALEHCGFPLAGVNDTREASLRAWRHTLAPLLRMPPEWLAEDPANCSSSSKSNSKNDPSSTTGEAEKVVAALCPGCPQATAQVLVEALHARATHSGRRSTSSRVSAAAAAAAAGAASGGSSQSAADAAEVEYAKLMGDDLQTLEALPFPVERCMQYYRPFCGPSLYFGTFFWPPQV